jgi:hypothetical protein
VVDPLDLELLVYGYSCFLQHVSQLGSRAALFQNRASRARQCHETPPPTKLVT